MPAVDHGIWAHLLTLAARSQDQVPYGTIGIASKIGYPDDLLARLCGTTTRQWRATKSKLIKTQQIEVCEGNIIKIVNWKKYQSESLRKLSERNNVPSNVPFNVPSNVPPLEREREREREKTTAPLKDLRAVVEGFKALKGFTDDVSWDRAHFRRCVPAAKQLLEYLGTVELCLACLSTVAKEMEKKGLSWTLETIVKHSAEWKKQQPKPMTEEEQQWERDKWKKLKDL